MSCPRPTSCVSPSTPALLLTIVKFLTPFSLTAAIKFSGMPHKPKPLKNYVTVASENY